MCNFDEGPARGFYAGGAERPEGGLQEDVHTQAEPQKGQISVIYY